MNGIGPLYNQSYIDTGHGPVVILLHGLFGNLKMWHKTVDALKQKFRVIVPRLPLFDSNVEHTDLNRLTEVLHEFIEWNNLKDVTLVGHSLGGQAALFYASQHPAHVKKIVLSACGGWFQRQSFDTDNQTESDDEDALMAIYHPESTPDQLIEEAYATRQQIPKQFTVGSLIRTLKHKNPPVLLSRIDHPILLIWGVEDRISQAEVALNFYNCLQNSEIRFIPECGHLPMVEQANHYNHHVVEFLKG